MKPKIIALYNAKGGVGKTTSTVNISTVLAQLNYKVLIIDLDPQGNATRLIGINKDNIKHSTLDMLINGIAVEDVIMTVDIPETNTIDVIPCKRDLIYAEEHIYIGKLFNKQHSLKNLMKDIKENYDYILIDCPPSLSELTINALVFATDVLVPVKIDLFSFEGLSELSAKVDQIKYDYNNNLNFSGIFLTMFTNTNVNKQVKDNLYGLLGDKVFSSNIRQSNSVIESTFIPAPVVLYKKNCTASIDYKSLVNEMTEKIVGVKNVQI